MEVQREFFAQRAGALVCRIHDSIVRSSRFIYRQVLTLCSVLIPWFTLREVPVEVEIVCSPKLVFYMD